MRVPFFYGEFDLSVDAKNRLLIPSEIRRLIIPESDGDAFFVTQRTKVPWFYLERFYEQLVSSQLRPDITPNDDLLDYAQLKFALASRVECDSQGRVLLPDKLLKRSGLGKEVTLIGMQDHLELWDRVEWEKRRERLIADSANIESRAKIALERQSIHRIQEP